MNIQIYWHKKNFETQKAERFFKERRIPCQSLDLKKHKLGRREAEILLRGNARKALDLEDIKVKSHPVGYTTDSETIIGYVLENPRFLISPIIRSGSAVIIGYDEGKLVELIGTG